MKSNDENHEIYEWQIIPVNYSPCILNELIIHVQYKMII